MEGSIRWEISFHLSLFQKILKKIQNLAFTDKVKIIKTYVPEKVKIFIEKIFRRIKVFHKKYLFKIEIYSNEKLIIPEYKIDLFNKSKKMIDKVENINEIQITTKLTDNKIKPKKENKKVKKETKKVKTKKKLRTLWVRRKKN